MNFTNMPLEQFWSTYDFLSNALIIYSPIAFLLIIVLIILTRSNLRKYKEDSSNIKYKKLSNTFIILAVIVCIIWVVLYFLFYQAYSATFLFEANEL